MEIKGNFFYKSYILTTDECDDISIECEELFDELIKNYWPKTEAGNYNYSACPYESGKYQILFYILY